MISEESHDTEDWSKDVQNSALHHSIYICTIYKHKYKHFVWSQAHMHAN